jgi:hypothetical protein
MQLWLWAKVEIGRRSSGFAGYEGYILVGEETNIVVMKPDMAVTALAI